MAMSRGQQIWLIVFLGVMSAMAPLSTDMYLPALPTVQADLGISASMAQLTLTMTLIGMAVGDAASEVGRPCARCCSAQVLGSHTAGGGTFSAGGLPDCRANLVYGAYAVHYSCASVGDRSCQFFVSALPTGEECWQCKCFDRLFFDDPRRGYDAGGWYCW